MADAHNPIILWYIDRIVAQYVEPDGIPIYDNLYLELAGYASGDGIEDDRDELEEALYFLRA